MQSPTPLADDENSALLLAAYVVSAVLLITLLLIVIVLFTTDVNVTLGAALGVNLRSNDNLVIYDASCRKESKWASVSLIYWTPDSAPLTLSLDGLESSVINSPIGVNTLAVTIRTGAECPKQITLTDKSRNRLTDSAVEIRQ